MRSSGRVPRLCGFWNRLRALAARGFIGLYLGSDSVVRLGDDSFVNVQIGFSALSQLYCLAQAIIF